MMVSLAAFTASGDVVNGVWTGASDSFWTNANNWAGGVVPGRYLVPDGMGGVATNGIGCCTATFGEIADGASAVIDLDGLLSVTNITVSSPSRAYTFGTSSAQQIPIESGGKLSIASGSKAPILAGTMLYAANVSYSYWNGPKIGGVQQYTGITIDNKSSEELVINDFGPVSIVGSTDEICNIAKDTTLDSLIITEVRWTLTGTGSVRFKGERKNYIKMNGTTTGYNIFHIYHQLVNPAQITADTELYTRLHVSYGNSYGKGLVEVTGDGCLRPGTWGIYGLIAEASRETRIFGDGLVRFDAYRGSQSGKYFPISCKLAMSGNVRIETDAVAGISPGTSWAFTGFPNYVPGLDMGTSAGSLEFFGDTSITGTIHVSGSTLRTRDMGADGYKASFGVGSLAFCNSGRLFYNGPGETTTRTLAITNRAQSTYNVEIVAGTPAATLEQGGSGVWNVASPLVMAGCTDGATLILANSTVADAVYSSVLADGPGPLSLRKTGTGKWILAAANTYTGATEVNGGTLEIASGASIASSSGLSFGGGTVKLPDYGAATPVSLPAMTLASGASSVNVGGNVELSIAGITQSGAAATIDFVVESYPVKILVAGLADGDAPAYITVNGLATTYSTTDGLAIPGTIWKAAVDGDWSDGTKWSDGAVPAANASIFFNAYGPDYAARVTTPVSLEGTLALFNKKGGAAATMAISNAVTSATTNGITIGEGGRILVGAGGAFNYDNSALTPITYSREFMTVDAGGVLEIDGGDAVFTNFNGNIVVKGESDNPGTVLVKSGNLVLSGRPHPKNQGTDLAYGGDERLRVKEGGRYVQTGGMLALYSFHNGNCPLSIDGGEADFSGDGVLRMFCGAWSDTGADINPRYVSGTGTVRFRGNAVLDPYVRSTDCSIYVKPGANSSGVLEFHDHARFDAPRAEKGTKLGTLTIGGEVGSYSKLGLYSDAVHNDSYNASGTSYRSAGYIVCVGDGYGVAELEMTNGTFGAGAYGTAVAAVHNTAAASGKPWAVTGTVHLAGGTYHSDGGASIHAGWAGPGRMFGDMVGSSVNQSAGTFVGRVEMTGGTYDNYHCPLLIGYGFGEGEWNMAGGSMTVVSDTSYSYAAKYNNITIEKQYATNNIFAIGMAGGKGRFAQTGGDMQSNLRVFVGGIVTNDLSVHMAYIKTWGTGFSDYMQRGYGDRHGAEGYLGVLGGTFTAAHSIFVGQDGTGVLEIGPTGTLSAAAIVLTNNAYTASGSAAATLKFTFGEEGVGSATVTNLVVAPGSRLVVDMSAYPIATRKTSRFNLLKADGVEGVFADADVSLILPDSSHASQVQLDCSSNGITVFMQHGMSIIFR